MTDLENLKNAPVVEVACSVIFEPNPMLFESQRHGLYWSTIKEEYPEIDVRPAITSSGSHWFGPSKPERTLLISADSSIVVQIQFDRFIFNWRKTSGDYPRFTEILAKFRGNFDAFIDFCAPVGIGRVELTKVNNLDARHWIDSDDLCELAPVLSFVKLLETIDFNFAFRSRETLVKFTTRTPQAIRNDLISVEKVDDGESPIDVLGTLNEKTNTVFSEVFNTEKFR